MFPPAPLSHSLFRHSTSCHFLLFCWLLLRANNLDIVFVRGWSARARARVMDLIWGLLRIVTASSCYFSSITSTAGATSPLRIHLLPSTFGSHFALRSHSSPGSGHTCVLLTCSILPFFPDAVQMRLCSHWEQVEFAAHLRAPLIIQIQGGLLRLRKHVRRLWYVCAFQLPFLARLVQRGSVACY